jgi:hypothetical protein
LTVDESRKEGEVKEGRKEGRKGLNDFLVEREQKNKRERKEKQSSLSSNDQHHFPSEPFRLKKEKKKDR